MKKVLVTLLVVFLTIGVAGCAKDNSTPTNNTGIPETLADGTYFAQEDFFPGSGWKYVVTLEVKEGKIVSADWNGAHVNGGKDKKTSSIDGDYGMVAKGGAQAEWHEQAALTEAYLIETQDPTGITYTSEEGHTDDIAGVSIHVSEFYDLVQEALAAGPSETGPWKDGAFYAEEAEFKNGYKYFVNLTVINGHIISASWDALAEDGGTNKKQAAVDGAYVMNAEKGEWHEQAALVEELLLETQNPSEFDDIASVSITVDSFFTLAQEALETR
jgi:major membrane immunogen (membrane-anchored lipoprotein)